MTAKSIHLQASMKNWDEFISFIDEASEIKGLSSKRKYRLKLAAEELLSNIICSSESSTKTTASKPFLHISFEMVRLAGSHCLELILRDNAPQFDPKFYEMEPPKHIQAPVALKPIGGLGLFLVKDSVDSVSYKYHDGHNVYTLEMELNSELDQ
jgi:anti-sigma regulatory factor (Ser/Thr protein kinase)